ncbi:RTA1 like protein-domain-containing protein [Amylocarpus encephaloides]|uniref:RTA1 like protein-domain-containing protein n=1 Tax=Amylocarpus encephaloides TaxID=45428 RepID=A0A9P7YHV3_9HELO|nr:RTA1 like protein-domain-containing protein [Amylocarpus encephaloides]
MALCWVILDIFSFIVQIGGGLLVVSKNLNTKKTGLRIYTGGLALQLFFILFFTFLVYTFQKRVKVEASSEHQRQAKKLAITLGASLTFICIRIIYRMLEFAGDFQSKLTQELWNHEVYQYVLDAVPMLLALITMNVVHPGTIIPGDKSTFKQFTPMQNEELHQREKNAVSHSSAEGVMVH